jgi:hypothetical protein
MKFKMPGAIRKNVVQTAIHQAKSSLSQSNYFSAVACYFFVRERMFDHPVH